MKANSKNFINDEIRNLYAPDALICEDCGSSENVAFTDDDLELCDECALERASE